jgi:hypothetical protein
VVKAAVVAVMVVSGLFRAETGGSLKRTALVRIDPGLLVWDSSHNEQKWVTFGERRPFWGGQNFRVGPTAFTDQRTPSMWSYSGNLVVNPGGSDRSIVPLRRASLRRRCRRRPAERWRFAARPR